MNVVGKVGSFITQGVYSVATPFHPFGGAVDIIVVQQQDGSFRSTPWYVQFGKFQGVLKGAEKMVRINVNGVEANFHMFLDNSGEAYFVREAETCKDGEKNQVSTDEREGALEHSLSVDNSQCNINNDNVENFRLQSTLSDPGVLTDDFSSFRADHLERTDSDVCRFYDFQDDQSFEGELSPDYGSGRYENMDAVENFVEAQGSDSEMVLVSVDGHILTAPISSSEQSTENVQLDTPQFHLGPGESDGFCDGNGEFTVSRSTWDSEFIDDLGISSNKATSLASCDNNDNASHESLTHKFKVEENSTHNYCQEDGDNGWQGEEDCGMCTMDSVKEYAILVREANGIQNMHLNGQPEEDTEHPDQDNDNVSANKQDIDLHVASDAEDLSPSIKNDKFKSCLDLTTAAVSDSSDKDDSSITSHEEVTCPEEKDAQNFQVSNSTEIGASEIACLDGENGTNIDLSSVEVKVNADGSSSSTASDFYADNSDAILSNTVKESIKSSIEDIDKECTSTGNTSLHKDEQTGLNVLDSSSKDSAERDFAGTESDRSEVLHLQSRSSSAQGQANRSPLLEISLCRHLLQPGMGTDAANEAFNLHRISEGEFKSSPVSAVKNENLVIRYKGKYLPWDQAAPIVLGIAAFGIGLSIDSKYVIPVEQEVTLKSGESDSRNASGRRWRLWSIPFRRVKTIHESNSSSSEEVFVDPESALQNPSIDSIPLTLTSQSGTPRSATSSKSPHKKIVRTNIPTNEQIEFLNLKEGQNDVTFSFSTRVLGVQQVEAHIYLWKWNARIVISDVDGTITKSDVLGQFMPLVGKDWSQSGVARLFTAIKENGYQLLFLSARAIVQAYLTKSFLFNLKQDGKTLPNGPVVISPNGLFPSLFREVIRRAPHEFKIACLEDIKALFPAEYNPFYAGFGNRDTDELTYRKIGIPKGKIFIINPKGEVAINHQIDVRSYTSLHTLVNDMFPPTSMAEQEDYNHWNYWKVPLPDIDD